uniref:Alternative protein NUP205 n=1 Tax=Homo sapiens TaxID=9606 RepID=L8E861_HUMAN|nr:alternative protein NUP205 [Homo sapiens]
MFNSMRRFRKPVQRESPFRVNRELDFFLNSSLKKPLFSVTFLILENWQLLSFFLLESINSHIFLALPED